jgi:hypothetical protein
MRFIIIPIFLLAVLAGCSKSSRVVDSNNTQVATPENSHSDSLGKVGTPDRAGYFVIGFGSHDQSEATQESERRIQEGLNTHVVNSSDWSGLSPGWYIVLYGIFDEKPQAEAELQNLKSRGINAYAKFSGVFNPSQGQIAVTKGVDSTLQEEADAGNAEMDRHLAIEAQTKADEWLNTRSRRCGQYYRLKISESRAIWFPQIVRAPTVAVEGQYIPPRSLTESDKLNGVDPQPIEWQGTIVLSFGPWRSRTMQLSQMVWSQWSEAYQGHFPIVRKKHQWEIRRSGIEVIPFECAEIPQDAR